MGKFWTGASMEVPHTSFLLALFGYMIVLVALWLVAEVVCMDLED